MRNYRNTIAAIFFFTVASVQATTYYSIGSGDISSASIWSTTSATGASCGCSPGGGGITIIIEPGDYITDASNYTFGNGNVMTISAGATFDLGGNSLTVDGGATLTVSGTLIAKGITFSNGAAVTVSVGGVITDKGTFTNTGGATTKINGTMSVSSTATVSGGSSISGTGSMTVTGTLTTSGGSSVFGNGSANCTNCTASNIGLPIVLKSYTAEYNNDAVSLTWASATETNNNFYSVERSLDGVNYTLVTQVKGAGTSTVTHNYSATDPDPVNGVNYYRLSQTDEDGRTTYLNTIPVSVDMNIKGLTLFPNPAKNNIMVSFSDTRNEYIQLSVYDYMGREISANTIQALPGVNTENVALDKCAPGIYFVTLPVNGQVLKTKFIKN